MCICLDFSVPRCPRDDLHWFRVPDDVPEEIWVQFSGVQLPAGGSDDPMGGVVRGILRTERP